MNPIEKALAQADAITTANVELEKASRVVVPTYRVTFSTPKGMFDVDVPTFQGAEAAGRRALMLLAAQGYGDLPDLHQVSATLLPANASA